MARGASVQDTESTTGAAALGLKDVVVDKRRVSTCPSEASTTCESVSVASTDSCSWEDDCDVDEPARSRSGTETSEMWEDDFSDDDKLEREMWMARFCRKAAPVQLSEDAPRASESSAAAADEWCLLTTIMQAWNELPSEMQQALSLW